MKFRQLPGIIACAAVVLCCVTASWGSVVSSISLTINEETGKLDYSYTISNLNSGNAVTGTLTSALGEWDSQGDTMSWTLGGISGVNVYTAPHGTASPGTDKYQALIVTQPGNDPTKGTSLVSDLITIDSGTHPGSPRTPVTSQLITVYDQTVDAGDPAPGVTAVKAYGKVAGYTGEITDVTGVEADLNTNHSAGFNFAVASEHFLPGGKFGTDPVTGITLYYSTSAGGTVTPFTSTTIAFREKPDVAEIPLPAAVWMALPVMGLMLGVTFLRRRQATI